jgi:hypothetical protein
MWSQDSNVESKIAELGEHACVELFDAYGLELTPHPRPFERSDRRLFSGSIGFVGRRLRGTCLLASESEPLLASCPERDGAPRDWIGELTNQFVGRLKTKLLSHGVEVFVTTPIVLSGVRIEPLPRNRTEPFVFQSNVGGVMAWVEVETEEGFALGSEESGRSGGEGDVILL